MHKIKVTYFLNDAGKKIFPEWYEVVLRITSKQDGFVNMRCESFDDSTSVYLDFESRELLQEWTDTEIHDELAESIEHYLIKKSVMAEGF